MQGFDETQRPAFGRVAYRRTGSIGHRRSLLRQLLDRLLDWQRRYEERQAVLEMDERLLRDMGVSRQELLDYVDGRG